MKGKGGVRRGEGKEEGEGGGAIKRTGPSMVLQLVSTLCGPYLS